MTEYLEFQKFPKIPRLNREIIITEKIDGTNAQLLITEEPITASLAVHPGTVYSASSPAIQTRTSRIWAGSRKRWLLPERDNHGFAAWVAEHEEELLRLGPGRHFGEWWGQGINRGYGLDHKRFSLFNVNRWAVRGQLPLKVDSQYIPKCCSLVPILRRHVPFTTQQVNECLNELYGYGSAAAPGFMQPEGIVIYHTAGNCLFKVTLENDDKPKKKDNANREKT